MVASIICVYNDRNAYEKMLCKSIENQDCEYELIGIDNSNGKFSCAAKALNYGASKANTDVLIFSHQDVYIKTNDAIRSFAKAIQELPVGCIIGTQGVREKKKIYYSNITYGSKFLPDLNHSLENRLYDVASVDEGFFGMKKATWRNHNFDEKLCDNWHLYCVETCLWNRNNNGRVYVYPIQLHHYSMGTITLGYMKNLKLLCKAYRKDFKYIWTTCYKVKTNVFYINMLYILWVFNRKIRGKLK